MKSPAEFHRTLVELEVSESKFKFARSLEFHSRPPADLIVHEIEGSLLTLSSWADEKFSSFNVARIQDTSPNGVSEILKILSEHGQKHVLVTGPLGLSEGAYSELSKHGYSIFQNRSVLGLRELSKDSSSSTALEIDAIDSAEQLSSAFDVLNSFLPTSQADFDASYTYWLKQNNSAKLFIARENGKAIGMGILSWKGEVGILSSGVVNPNFRGRGIQKALVMRRIQEAAKLGVRSLFAPGVPPFSASEANLKSCSFDLICNRSVWKRI